MKNLIFLISAAILLTLTIVSCSKNKENLPTEPVPIELSANQAQLIESGNGFAFDIFREIAENESESKNLMISPLSISVALSMTLNGAEGKTREAILGTLRSAGITTASINDSYKSLSESLLSVDKRVLISIANSVWTEQTFPAKKNFIDNLKNYYQAETSSYSKTNLPLAVTNINNWIDDKTNGLIKKMIESLSPDDVMLLINAIYFKGKWNMQFDKANTVNEQFNLAGGSSAQVPMMKQKSNFKVVQNNNLLMAEFPYGQGNYVMDVILPAGSGSQELNSIIRTITPESFNQLAKSMNSREINLVFPRFKYGYKKELNDILSDMGMSVAFTENADFSGISDVDVLISKVLHQSFIETNEEGTEAAAATSVQFTVTSVQPEPLLVRLDRPFIYIIRETSTNSVIFIGRVSNPAAE